MRHGSIFEFFPGARAAALALGVVLLAMQQAPARADEIDDLRREVEQLKQQVLFLQNQVPLGGGNAAAQQEVRWQELDRQLAELTGHIERVEIKVNDLAGQLERLQKDVEFRLSSLEGGGTLPADGSGVGADTMAQNAQTTPDSAGQPTDLSSGSQVAANPPEPSQSAAAEQPTAAQAQSQTTGVLGTLTSEQAANLPQAPAGAAEAAAAAAGAAVPVPPQAAPQTSESRAPVAPISLPGSTPREKYDFATGLLQQGNYDMAEAALKTFVMQYPSDELAGNAQYWLGETYYVRGDFRGAAVAFAEGYQKYPQSAKAPDNLLKLAMSLGQQGQTQNACVALRQLDKKFPNAPANIKDRSQRAKERYSCN